MSDDPVFALRDHFGPDAPRRVGVAVSGGGDSLALLVALAEAGLAPEAVTVDHGLRAEAADEAAFVARFCADRGIPHAVLHWEGAQARGNLMDAARRARLSLIGAWARARGLADVALGHTADDQAETLLMRLARAAGLEGLAGMRARFEAEGVRWHRPLLTLPRADLRAFLSARKLVWVEDPSNENERFERVKARRALKALRPVGVTPPRLVQVVHHLAAADEALGATLQAWAAAHLCEDRGDLVFSRTDFAALHPELQRRLVNAALIWVAGADYAPRAAKLASWLADPRTATLHGCRITASEAEVRVSREAKAVAGLRVPLGAQWDRWVLDGPARPGLEIAALGAEGLGQLPDWRESGMPRASLLASPAVWQGETLVAAPLAGQENGWKARIACGTFAKSLIRR